MNIDLFVSKKGHPVFACHGQFDKQVSQVVVTEKTGQVFMIFKPDLEVRFLNCTLDPELCKKLKNQLFCSLGYFEGKKLVAAEYARFMVRPDS